jgi:hypothetical protein
MTAPAFGEVLQEWSVGELSLVCEYANTPGCPDDPATWVLHTKRCECGFSTIRLACTTCKEARMSTEDGVWCELCGAVTIPARHAYVQVQRIDGKPVS